MNLKQVVTYRCKRRPTTLILSMDAFPPSPQRRAAMNALVQFSIRILSAEQLIGVGDNNIFKASRAARKGESSGNSISLTPTRGCRKDSEVLSKPFSSIEIIAVPY